MARELSANTVSQGTLNQYRRVVADVVGFLRSQEVLKSYASVSLEELIDQRIDRIEAPVTSNRPGHLARLASLKEAFDAAIEGIRETPADAFRFPDPSNDANTPEVPEGSSNRRPGVSAEDFE